MTMQELRDDLARQYREALAARRHKRADRLHVRLVAITTALLIDGL